MQLQICSSFVRDNFYDFFWVIDWVLRDDEKTLTRLNSVIHDKHSHLRC